MKGKRLDNIEAITEKIARRTEEHFGRRFPGGLPAQEVALGKINYRPRKVLGGIQFCNLQILKINLYEESPKTF